jgi:tetratricopeptide (TPR) repeat protein
MQHENRMTERERYRNRAVFYATAGNWHKCVDEGEELVKRYPADRVGAFNLATCYAQLRNFPKAVTAGRRALDIVPKGVPQRHNLAFLSSFSGDFQNGEKQARAALELNATSEPSMLALAEAQMGQGNIAAATESYRGLEKLGPSGASIASAGIADVGIYEGRFGDAVQALENGATADLKEKNADAAASKFAAIAYAELSRGQKTKAVAAADKALANSQAISVKFLAARIYAETGHADKAQKLAAALGSELQAEPQAYSKIIQGMLFSQHGNAPQAIKTLTDANNLLDTWMGRFELGRAYLKAGALVEADSEFDRCIRRSGEALEFFMDDAPTYGFLPPVYYYQGKVREGMKNPEFANSYKTYANIRGRSNEDPLLQEVHQKVGQ